MHDTDLCHAEAWGLVLQILQTNSHFQSHFISGGFTVLLSEITALLLVILKGTSKHIIPWFKKIIFNELSLSQNLPIMNHTNKNPEYIHQDFRKKKKSVGKHLENKYLKAKINMDIIS